MNRSHVLLVSLLVSACTTDETKPPAGVGAAGHSGPSGVGAPAAGVTAAAASGSGASPAGRAGTTASGQSGAGAGAAGKPAAVGDDDAGVAEPSDAGEDSAAPDASAPRSTGPGDWVAGDYPAGLNMQTYLELTGLPRQGGSARQYKVHVPPSYRPDTPMPLVFCFHGLGQNAVMFCVDGAGMPAKSDSAGFILVMPNGYQSSWNAGTCCGAAATEKLDEVGFVRAVFKEVSGHLNIDLSRVYATGLSNGGYLSFRLACEAADLFVAVAPGAGAIGTTEIGGGTSTTSDLTSCTPSAKVSVLEIHGTMDGLIAYSTQKPSLDRMAMQNGCQLTTQPAEQPASTADTTCTSYTGCPSGIDVTGCSVRDGGHVWFGSPNCGTGVEFACVFVGNNSPSFVNTDVIWEFFSRHSR